jgi:hypothetical protein
MTDTGLWRFGPEAGFCDDADLRLIHRLSVIWPSHLRQPAPPGDEWPTWSLRQEDDRIFLLHEECVVATVPERGIVPLLEKLTGAWIQAFTRSAAILHAGLLVENGLALLLPAERGSGKSTFCLLRAKRGAWYGGDDLVAIDLRAREIHPLPKAITLKAGAFPFAPEADETWLDPARGPLRYWHPPRVITDPVPWSGLRALVFPRYAPGEPASVVDLPPPLAALHLVRQLFGGLERSPDHLNLVQALTRIPAVQLTYPDAETLHAQADALTGASS